MNGKILGFLTAALMAVCALIASPAFSSTFTYDYTGVITYADSQVYSIAIGSQVSGTYTFVNPAQPSSLVFASTAQVDGFYYNTPSLANLSSDPYGYAHSSVQGSANSGTFTASEQWVTAPDTVGSSSLTISNPHGGYPLSGVPILALATSATGEVNAFIASEPTQIDFKITSFTPAPEIDPASAATGLTLLMSVLAMALGARRSRAPEHRKGCAVV
jgi:hypothetical protein